jgi:hypothetical protein
MTSATHQTTATAAPNAAAEAAPPQGILVSRRSPLFAITLVFWGAGLLPLPARAVDGCLVLLCLAAPNWQNIAQCVDPVRQVLRDLARGRPFPTCAMSGNGSSASNQSSSAPAYCPPQYTSSYDSYDRAVYVCAYAGAVEVNVDGALWSRVWWNPSGDSVTEFTPAAQSRLGTWDSRFEDEYAAWLAAQPPPAPPGPVN